MEFDRLIEERFSCREFLDKEIKDEDINHILMAANLAPTAKNKQPIKIIVIKNKELLEKIKLATPCTFNAKLVFVICNDTNKCWIRSTDSKYHGDIDATIVATHMMLEITNINLGSTFVCAFDKDKLKEVLGLDNNIEPTCLLPVGYPKEIKAHNTRKDISEIVEFR